MYVYQFRLLYSFYCCRIIASCTEKLTFGPVPAYREPVIYNLAVTRELFKQIYIKEGLHPPSIAAFREAYSSIWSQVTNPGFVGGLLRSGEIGRVGIHGLQAYGIFKVSNAFASITTSSNPVEFRLAKSLAAAVSLVTSSIRTS
jgi:hypothetical protein